MNLNIYCSQCELFCLITKFKYIIMQCTGKADLYTCTCVFRVNHNFKLICQLVQNFSCEHSCSRKSVRNKN